MRLCVFPGWTLVSLIFLYITVVESSVPPVVVKYNDSATLPCSERCSGLVIWTVFSKPSDPLAECDQTSCRSVKEGYQMIHDQYLNGNLSLTITGADLSKRGWYTCTCNGRGVCDSQLLVEPLNTPVYVKPGDPLYLDLDVEISDTVKVIFNSTDPAGPSRAQVCKVDGRSAHCEPGYTQRASVVSALELRGVTPSDGGVYTVMDELNEEALHTYTVTVGDCEPHKDQSGWMVPLLAVTVAILLVVCVLSVRMNLRQRSEIQQLRKTPGENGGENHALNGVLMKDLSNGAEEHHKLDRDQESAAV